MKRIFALVLATVVCSSCANQQILRSAATPTPDAANSPAPVNAVEQEIKAMRTADFNFISIFRRKDGAPLDAADKKIASENIPPEINRRKVIDDGKAIIIGSNFRLPPENFKVLASRFAVEDYCKPENEIIDTNASLDAGK